MKTVKEKASLSFESLKGVFGYKNRMQAPRITKVTVSVGTGRMMKADPKKNDFIMDRLTKITGQKARTTAAKQSIASFKIRQGDKVGVSVTLRGPKMYAFLDKLVSVAIPRTKDFRGLERTIVDNMGNLTMSVKEHTIFPEAGDEELRDVFSLAITIGTTATNKKEATGFFELIGIPFKEAK